MRLLAAALLVLILPATSARAAESYDNCVGYVDTLPAIITTQGVWCLRADLATAITSGNAIHVNTNNVTIDCNGFKLGGLGAGPSSTARGIHALGRQNITVRNCLIRGFLLGVSLEDNVGGLVENNVAEGSYFAGIWMNGGEDGNIRRNRIRDSGKPASGGFAYGIYVAGVHDIIENTVTGVEQTNAVGIFLGDAPGGTVNGNRVRTLFGAAESFAFLVSSSPGALVRDNHTRGPGSFGILCLGDEAIAVGNTVSTFLTEIDPNCLSSGNVVQ